MANHVIFIKRMWQTKKSTISQLTISGLSFQAYILERPGPDSITPNKSLRIPEGSYKIKWHNSSIYGVQSHNPVPLLYNAQVPQSRYILIHNGNFPRDSEGCLLIGTSKGQDQINNSVAKLIELKELIEKEGIENFTVIISSCYSSCK